MSLRNILAVPDRPAPTVLALLLLRSVMGVAFLFHGWGKIQNPFGWMGPDGFAPPVFQALAALSEFGGGASLVVGLLTPLACLGIGSTMAAALWQHAVVRGDPFVGRGGSYELASVYLCIVLVFLTMGPGRFALDRLIFGKRRAAT